MYKLIGKHNNTYHCFIGKTPIDTDFSAFPKEIKANPKSSKFKVGKNVRIVKYNNNFGKQYTINWSKKIVNSVSKSNPLTYKIKDLNGKKIRSFYQQK